MTSPRRLIVNADDFGRAASINAAVIRAHREGILTSASLMMNEPSCAAAVQLAKANPHLGVGLHLTLLMGHSALPHARIPGLVNECGEFSNAPAATGLRYFFRRELREQLRAEIHAQFARFRDTGIKLDHVNGHLHMHLHPVVFRILMDDATVLGITHLRWTRDPFWRNARIASGRWPYRTSHALIFNWLTARARKPLHARGIKHTRAVFGLLQNGNVDEDYLVKLLKALPAGDSELYSHPSLDEFPEELEALVCPRVKALVQSEGIQLIRYQDL